MFSKKMCSAVMLAVLSCTMLAEAGSWGIKRERASEAAAATVAAATVAALAPVDDELILRRLLDKYVLVTYDRSNYKLRIDVDSVKFGSPDVVETVAAIPTERLAGFFQQKAKRDTDVDLRMRQAYKAALVFKEAVGVPDNPECIIHISIRKK